MSTDIASASEVVSGTKLSRHGKELLMELKRSDWLPGYASEKIQLVCKDIDEHFKNMDHLMKSIDGEQGLPDNLKACLLIHYHTVQRNKRCLMAYTDYRLSKIEKLKWEYGSVIPSQYVPKLSQSEVQYFKKYDNLLNDYMRSIDIELTSMASPPKDLYIEVRVVKSCGEVVTESGVLSLEEGTIHYLRQSDIEHLLRQGVVERI